MGYFAGIDVGGPDKGFHGAILQEESQTIDHLFQGFDPEELIGDIVSFTDEDNCLRVAVDSPPKASVDSDQTRLAERQLRSDGYHVLWTPREKSIDSSPKWLRNGEDLWNKLESKFGRKRVIETFPTASTDGIGRVDVGLPLNLLGLPDDGFNHREDLVDASICSVVAREHYRNEEALRIYGQSSSDREDENAGDQLGPIYVL